MRCKLLLLACCLGCAAAVVFAQDETDRIIFPHALHVEDVGVTCLECHEAVETSTQLASDLLPVMDQCSDCHDGDTAPDDCDLCHTVPDDPATYSWKPVPGLLFPHQTHLAREIECRHCHPAVAGAEALARRVLPSMEPCMSCHTTPLSDADCSMCHATLDGKLPATHGPEWARTHGLFAHGDGPNECALCHQQSDCESCHAQAQLETKVHVPNYEFLHAGDFFGFEKECATCHAMPRECMSCHMARAVMPVSHNSVQWVNAFDGGFHQEEALDKPDYCVVCHEPAGDQTCQRCHGAN